MFRIEEKDYDLNYLLRFDMLREILMKLLKNQKNLQNEIDLLKNSNKERDDKIVNIEQLITELQEESNKNEVEMEPQKEAEFEDNNQKIIEEKEMNNLNNNININNQIEKTTEAININNIKQPENIEQQKEDNKEINKESDKKENKEEFKEEKEKGENKEVMVKKEENEKNLSDRTSNKSNNELTERTQTVLNSEKRHSHKKKSSMKEKDQISLNNKELISKINLLEIKLNNLYSSKDLKNIRQELKNHDLENQSDFKVIDMKFNDINEKLEDLNKKLEDCSLKLASFDILNMIKDSGDGTVDGAKILFKSLEDKCNKKFEIIDARYKQEASINEKMKKSVENIVPVFDKINRDIAYLKEIEEQQKEEIENTKKNIETQNETSAKSQKEAEDELIKKLNELETNFNIKIEEVENKMKLIKKGEAGPLFNLNLNDNDNENNNKANEEKFQILDKKISDVRTKLNDLNNTVKIFSHEEFQKIKNDVKELMYKIDTKIAKEDLKELYNMHLSDLDEINDLKDQISLIIEEQKKTSKDVQHSSSRIEMLNSNIIMLQNSQLNGGRGPVIDISTWTSNRHI